MDKKWQRLDNAALIFPSVATDRLTHVFRLAVNLAETVQPELVTQALHAVLPRFPTFRARLKPGFFWYSLVEEPLLPSVYPESASPCLPFHRRKREPLLLRVRWFGRRLAVEFSHTLTDGMGAQVFLKALTAEYLSLTGLDDRDPDDVRHLEGSPADENSDDFQNLYDPTFPRHSTWDRAFQPKSPLLPKGSYAVITGRVPLSRALAVAKTRHATLTEYLAATMIAAFQDVFAELPESERQSQARPLRLVLPVNLRPVFHSNTLRNFFVVVPVEIDLRLGFYDFDEIVHKVHHQLQAEMDPKLLKKQIVRNLRGELNPMTKPIPLLLKNLILSRVFGSYARAQTASLSNLGRVSWPDGWSTGIRSVDFTPPPSPYCPLNAGVVSFGDVLSITMGNLSADASVERAFFRRLRREDLAVIVESNRSALEV